MPAPIDISKGIDIGLAEPLKISFGAEHRYERFQTIAGDPAADANGLYRYPAGTPLAGRFATIGAQGAIVLTPDDAAKLSRNSYAAYIDVGFNPVPRWFVAVAGRAEHYDDSAGDTINGKFTTRYDFTGNFAIRGTVSNGFHAPALAQSAFAQTSNQYTTVNGVQTFITAKSVRPGTPIGDALGAKPLTPEKSFNLSAGFTYKLGSHFNLSVDAYQIKLDDRIAQTGYLTGAGVSAILVANGFDPNYSVRYFANAINIRTRTRCRTPMASRLIRPSHPSAPMAAIIMAACPSASERRTANDPPFRHTQARRLPVRVRFEAPRLFRRFQLVRRSICDEQDDEQIFS